MHAPLTMHALLIAVLAGCASGPDRRDEVLTALTNGTWAVTHETGPESELPTRLFWYYVFSSGGDLIGSDGFCAGVLTTYRVERDGRLVLRQDSRAERRRYAVESVIESFAFDTLLDDDAPDIRPEDVEAAWARSKTRPEAEWTDLERRAAEAMADVDGPLPIAEFAVQLDDDGALVLRKLAPSDQGGMLRLERRPPLTPVSIWPAPSEP